MITTSTPPYGWQKESEQKDVRERIRLRAYDLYEKRGKEDGCDMDDWLRAESELAQTVRGYPRVG